MKSYQDFSYNSSKLFVYYQQCTASAVIGQYEIPVSMAATPESAINALPSGHTAEPDHRKSRRDIFIPTRL